MVPIFALAAVLSGSFEVPPHTQVLGGGKLLISQSKYEFLLKDRDGKVLDFFDAKRSGKPFRSGLYSLFDDEKTRKSYDIVVRGNKIELQEVSRPHLEIIEGGSLRLTYGMRMYTYPIKLTDRYKGLRSGSFKEMYADNRLNIMFLRYDYARADRWPLVVTLNPSLRYDTGIGPGFSFVIDKESATPLGKPGDYSNVTYIDNRFILGAYGPGIYLHGATTGKDPSSIYRYDMKTKELKTVFTLKSESPPAGFKYHYKEIVPKAISSDGSAILYRLSEIATREDRSQVKTDRVIVSRDGKMETIKKVMVGWREVRPTGVVSAYRDLAILKGEDSRGESVTFTYRYD